MLIHAYAGEVLERIAIPHAARPGGARVFRQLERDLARARQGADDHGHRRLASTSTPIRARLPDPRHSRSTGKPLVYLDNAATTQKPRAVLDALTTTTRRATPTSTAACTTLSERATELYERRARRCARFIAPREPREIVFTRGTPPRASTWWRRPGAGPTSRPATRCRLGDGAPLQHRAVAACSASEKGAALRVIPIDRRRRARPGRVRARCSRRGRGSSRSPRVQRARHGEAGRRDHPPAHAAARSVLVDGAQAVAAHAGRRAGARLRLLRVHRPQAVRADRHRRPLRQGGAARGDAAVEGGGDMIASVTFEKTHLERDPRTSSRRARPTSPARSGSASAVEYLHGHRHGSRPGLRAGAAGLRHRRRWPRSRGCALVGTAPRKASILSFVMDNVHPHDLGTIVDREGVAIRTGQHCAQPVMDRLGIPATARASLAHVQHARGDRRAGRRRSHKARKVFG